MMDTSGEFQLNPRLVVALLSRGLARCGKGEIAAGLADFNRAIELAPREAKAWVTRGLEHYYLFHAARADLLRRLHRLPEAAASYSRAPALATNPFEQQYLRRRLGEVTK